MTRGAESSRERLLSAARTLYATRGFEATTTAAIAQAAGTSQSQLVKHFRDKQGALAAVLQSGWAELVAAVRLAIERIEAPHERLHLVIDMLLSYLAREREFRTIVLREGRQITRWAGGAPYADFVEVVDGILQQMLLAGNLLPHVNPKAISAGLLGALASMLYESDALAASGARLPFSEDELRDTARGFLAAMLVKPSEPTAIMQEPANPQWVTRYMELADKVLGRAGLA